MASRRPLVLVSGVRSELPSGDDLLANITLPGGSTTKAPLVFSSGSLLTTPQNGAFEYDGINFFATPGNANRGLIPGLNYIFQGSNRNLGNNASLQQLFDSVTSGTLDIDTGLYFWDALIYVTGMSGTSGNAKIDLKGAGNAVFGTCLWQALGFDNGVGTTATATSSMQNTVVSGTNILTASANTTLSVSLRGMFKITTAGTMIPSIQLQTASGAVVQAGSYFKCFKAGDENAVAVGKWT